MATFPSAAWTRASWLIAMLTAAIRVCLAVATEPEDDLRSVTVLAFLQNSRWPESESVKGPVTVGVVGRPSFARTLRRKLTGKSANRRPIRVLDLSSSIDPGCCQAVYFATDNASEIREALARVRGAHVLTMGETSRFLEYGGAVHLYLFEGHAAFEASLDTLDRDGIAISAKLLRIGRIRERTQGGPPR